MEKQIKDGIWVISDGRLIKQDLSSISEEVAFGKLMEYDISELAYYLLNPNPIKVEDRVVGCRVKYHKSSRGIVKGFFNKLKSDKTGADSGDSEIEEIISLSKTGSPTFKDRQLNLQFIKINKLLRPYDPVQKKLAALDREKIKDITAICEEIGGNRYPLNLSGSINEKINFLSSSISKKTKVIFSKAYLLNGLFEMRGFKFDSYRKAVKYKLIRFAMKDEIKYCVMNSDYKLEYWISDNMLLQYLLLFQQSIRTDPGLREVLDLCAVGKAKPLKLFFSKQLEQKYSEKRLPTTYREIFNTFNIASSKKGPISGLLNSNQSVVFFSYAPLSGDTNQKLYTNISVLHDFRALEPIRTEIPDLYYEIDKKASVSDAGKLYLMDSIRESQNV